MEIVLEGWARPLVVLHALSAMVLAGAATHQAWITLGLLRGEPRDRLARVYAPIVGVAYLTTCALGALAYPTFRVRVRAEHLDLGARWASSLFDFKEHLASLGVPLALGAWALSRGLDSRAEPRGVPLYASLSIGAALVVWIAVVSGLVVTLERGV